MLAKKVAVTGCWKSSETEMQSTDSQIVAVPRGTRTKENVDVVNNLVLSQEDMPQTHRTVCENLIVSW